MDCLAKSFRLYPILQAV